MVYFRNLKCVGLYSYGSPLDVQFTDQSIIVGPNNSGKSNLFRIINLFAEIFHSSRILYDWETFSRTTDASLEISLTFSEEEVAKIIDFLSFYAGAQNQTTEYHAFKNREFLLKNLDTARVRLIWEPTMYREGSEPIIEFEFEKIGLKIFSRGRFGTVIVSNKTPKNFNSFPQMENIKLNDVLDGLSNSENPREYIDKIFDAAGDKIILMHQINQNMSQTMPNEGKEIVKNIYTLLGFQLGKNYYISFLPVIGAILKGGIYHSADRRSLSKTFRDYAKKLETEDMEFNLKLREVAKTQTMNYADRLESDGSNLDQFLFSLKTSKNLEKRKKFDTIKHAFEDVIRSEDLSFDIHLEYENTTKSESVGAEESWKPAHPQIVIINRTQNRQYPLNQVGAGLLEVIYLLTLSYDVKRSIVLLDEPSLNLHPPLMRSLMNSMENAQNKNQFIIITHSPELLHYELFEGRGTIFYVRREDNASKIKSLNTELKQWFDENRSRFKHQVDTRIFFGKCVVLTEGESDKNLLGIAQYFESLDEGFSVTKNDIVITSVGGKKNFTKYRKFLEAYGIPYVILADLDARNEFESYGIISKDSIRQDGPVFIIENGDLEQLMKDIDSDIYNTVENEFKGSKPAIAFEFANRVADNSKDLETLKSFLEIIIKKAKTGS